MRTIKIDTYCKFIWWIMNIKKSALTLALASSLTLTACGGSSSNTPEPKKEELNTAPTNITLSNMAIAENLKTATLGNLTTVDANSNDTFSYSVSDARFVVTGSELKLAEGVELDFETEKTIEIEVTVTDSTSNKFTKAFTVEVTDTAEDTYNFDSKFITGESSVSYSGQIARHALIAELNHYIGSQLQADLDDGKLTDRQAILDKLNSFYNTSEEQYDNFPITFMTDTEQENIASISGSPKNLSSKIAGNDNKAMDQHKDWNNAGFAGWGETSSTTPEGLVNILFGQLADNAEQVILGSTRLDIANNEEITKIYLNADGTDLKQLIQKFLLMAVAYSQATDDYLDDANENKGLKSDFSQDGTKAYSKLEHQFDEGFGYFGASREYLAYNDNELSGKASDKDRAAWNKNHDTNGDKKFDLKSEVNFGNSVNAAKRDRGTAGNAMPTNYTKQIMEAFIAGRKILSDNAGTALTTEQFDALIAQRDIIVDGWERAIAATVVHYINDTKADLDKLGTDDFNFADTAKHFSELKGFALGLQFNPHSKISDEDFELFHTLIRNKPELQSENIEAYQADLIKARDIIAKALSFNAENVENW